MFMLDQLQPKFGEKHSDSQLKSITNYSHHIIRYTYLPSESLLQNVFIATMSQEGGRPMIVDPNDVNKKKRTTETPKEHRDRE